MQNILWDLSALSPWLFVPSLKELPLFTHLETIPPTLDGLFVLTLFAFGPAISSGSQDHKPKHGLPSQGGELSPEIEFVLTGCIDCECVKAMPKDEPKIDASFEFGSKAVRMWKDPDNKHHLIIVSSTPERVFLSCKPYADLLTEKGVAAILNLVEEIKPDQEASYVA